MKRLLFWSEVLFLCTFWWQTRFNLLRWFPGWAAPIGSIDYLIPFVYLSDVLFGAVLVLWGVGYVRNIGNFGNNFRGLEAHLAGLAVSPSRRLCTSPLFWFALLLISGIISNSINHVGAWGWYRWLKLAEAGLIGWWVFWRWRDEGRRKWYVMVLVAGLGFECLLLIGEWIKQGSLGLQWLGEWHFNVYTQGIAKIDWRGHKLLRPMGTFAHPNVIAGILAAALPLVWLFARVSGFGFRKVDLSRHSMHGNQYAVLWFSLAGVGLFLTWSRAGWLVGIIWAVIALLAWRRDKWTIGGIGLLSGLAILLAGGRFLTLLTTDSWSAGLRWELMKRAWQMWLANPLGVGINNFTLELVKTGSIYGMNWWQPVHNVWMLVLAEMGVLGILGLLGILVTVMGWLFMTGWRERRAMLPSCWILLGVWLSVLFLSLIDHYWWTSQQGLAAIGGLVGGTLLAQKSLDRGLWLEN